MKGSRLGQSVGVLLVASALAGCSGVVNPVPLHSGAVPMTARRTDTSARGPLASRTAAIADPGLGVTASIPIADDLNAARRIPLELDAMRHVLVLFALLTLLLGTLNAVLLAVIVQTLLRRGAPAATAALAAPAPTFEPAAAPADAPAEAAMAALPPAPRLCGCGAPVSARSKTGRCRSCASAARRATAIPQTA